MSKTQTDRPAATPASKPPLSPGVRRHLGQNLRTLYADSLSAPVSQRLEALIAQLDRPKA
ncbi:NepR family anti-sigma factor [Methylobacterium trifolii]|uniref:Anti-sigma factor NepR domain-containing protein n=1 Tax=Methylobacterium trifolii TaxID=1003092 RepID=A0ABQ4U5E3_9HYPH|nr:NepR family anti-sigma factor [Methylobacterium trifolii]GJE62319.1 hypothetical protein MPOCJGCO_4452 [Methylobacterium trifolii]